MQAILSDFNMAVSGDLAAAEESYVDRWPGLAAPTNVCSQKAWNMPCALVVRDKVLDEADQVSRARLLAAGCRESGVWLEADPVLSLGTQLDPEVLRIGIALRLGAQDCEGHRCRCGCNIDEKGYHPVSCRYSAGRFPRHAELNDVIRRALQRAGLPSILEVPGLDDGRRPDGITVFPFHNGRSLVWDCTCVDTFAASHLMGAAFEPGSAAGEEEMRKRLKYERLGDA